MTDKLSHFTEQQEARAGEIMGIVAVLVNKAKEQKDPAALLAIPFALGAILGKIRHSEPHAFSVTMKLVHDALDAGARAAKA